MKKDLGSQLAWDQAPHWRKRQKTGSNRKNIGERSKPSAILFVRQSRFFSPFPHSEEPCRRLVYSQTEITVNTRNISGMLLCCEKKKTTTTTIRHEKTKRQARTLITVCGFVASSRVLIFAVIGHNTITIPEVFQVFTIFPVPLKK